MGTTGSTRAGGVAPKFAPLFSSQAPPVTELLIKKKRFFFHHLPDIARYSSGLQLIFFTQKIQEIKEKKGSGREQENIKTQIQQERKRLTQHPDRTARQGGITAQDNALPEAELLQPLDVCGLHSAKDRLIAFIDT